jgi:hypothetical protein
MRLEGSSAATALAFFAAPLMVLLSKRWHCHKCGHVWDDPKEGPAAMTKLESDDPRPIFRLRRARAGMGLFLGLAACVLGAPLAALALPRELGALSVVVYLAPVVGWFIGRSLRYDVCSEPSCRTLLSPDREDCPRCKGDIAGVIRSADAHYAAAADFRRELAALRAKDRAAKKKKKRRSAGAPA